MPHPLSTPTRRLPARPDLDQLKRQAKELLAAFLAADTGAVAEVSAHYRDADSATFALNNAQLALARSYGFDSWPKLKAHVDGATIRRLTEAVREGDLAQVRAMLKTRPELAQMRVDNHNVLHYAVLKRSAEIVRVLMDHGANAREGVYPHRDATSALTIATERGYGEIVAIIQEAEQSRREAKTGRPGAPQSGELFRAISARDNQRAIAMLEANPALIATCSADGWTPLHIAAAHLNESIVAWLLDRGAALTARAAVAFGDADWLRARQAAGELVNPIEDAGGLLRIAVTHNRPEILELLLDFGLDPDERIRANDDEALPSWGMPLWHCAGAAKYELAEMLLKRGADPNGRVVASGDPMFQAYSQRDWKMVELLERYGGMANATTAGLYRQTELARKMLAGEAKYRLDGVGGDTLAEQLLWGSACGGDPEIVRMALAEIDWPRDDPRWFTALEQPLRIWAHGSGGKDWDRSTYLECFRLLLERCDPNILGRPQDQGQFGLTILHSIAGSREHVTPDERVAFATMLLDAGARLDIRDNLLKSTPLGWACRWGRVEMVKLLLRRGADPLETAAEPWATPWAWAKKNGDEAVLALLREHGAETAASENRRTADKEESQ